MSVAPANAPNGGKLSTSASGCKHAGSRLRESHREPVYAIAFNQVDASLATTFATVAANRATVYRLEEEWDADVTEAPPMLVTSVYGNKRLRSSRVLSTLQAYCDADEDQNLYCCAWGLDGAKKGQAGSLLAIGGALRHIKVLDVCMGGVRWVFHGHGGAINELQFHPHRTGLLLSASADESIRLWHVATGVCLASFLGDQGHRDAVVAIDVRPDGAAFASGSIDGTVKVWPIDDAALRRREAAADAAAAQGATRDATDAAGGAAGDGAAGGAAGGASAANIELAAEIDRPNIVYQRPAATYDRVHYDASAQLSYWVDCVRYVGCGLFLTRGSDGRALLWEGVEGRDAPAAGGGGGGVACGGTGKARAQPTNANASGDGGGARLLREFRLGACAGIWYLRFSLNAARTHLAMGNTRGEVLVWPLLKDSDSARPACKKPAVEARNGAGGAGQPAAAAGGSNTESKGEGDAEGSGPTLAVRACATLRVGDFQVPGSSGKSSKGSKGAKGGSKGSGDDATTVRCTAVSNDGECVVCGCDDGSVCVWELA